MWHRCREEGVGESDRVRGLKKIHKNIPKNVHINGRNNVLPYVCNYVYRNVLNSVHIERVETAPGLLKIVISKEKMLIFS